MKLLSLIFLVVFLTGIVLTQEEEPTPAEDLSREHDTKPIEESVMDKTEEDDWICVEIGPKRDPDTKVAEGVENKATHELSAENIRELTDDKKKYNSDDINCIIDRIFGDKYERYPMKCTQKNNTENVVKFFDHPFVINNRFSKTKAIKSYSGSHMMHCELYQPEGFRHTNETEWTWFKKIAHRQWDEIKMDELDSDVYIMSKEYLNTTLKIKSLTQDHEGEYKCTAKNPWGDHEHVFELRVMSFVALVVPFIATLCLMILLSVAIHTRENIIEKKELLKLMNQEMS